MVWIGRILLGLLAVLLLLLCMPVRVELLAQPEDPMRCLVCWLFLKIDLLKLKKDKTPKKKEAQSEKKDKEEQKKKTKKKKPAKRKMPLSDLLQIIWELLGASGRGLRLLGRWLKVYRLRLKLVVARGDAAETALAYGRVNAAVYGAYASLGNVLKLCRPDFTITPDFTGTQDQLELDIRLRLLPIQAVGILVQVLVDFFCRMLKNHLAQQKAAKAKPSA